MYSFSSGRQGSTPTRLRFLVASLAIAFSPLANSATILIDDFSAQTGQTVTVTGLGAQASAALSIGGNINRTLGVITSTSGLGQSSTVQVLGGMFVATAETPSANTSVYGFQYTGSFFSALGSTPQTLAISFDLLALDQNSRVSLAVPFHPGAAESTNITLLAARSYSNPGQRYEVSAYGDWSQGFDLRFYGPASMDVTIDNISLVPAPMTLALLGLGLSGIGLSRRKAVSA